MSVFENIEKRLKEIADSANISSEELKSLLTFKRIKKEKLNVDGKIYESWRIVHSDALGPSKGGIRFHPNVNEDEVKSLAFWMSLKNSLAGLPYGGAKGGIKLNPKELSEKELEKISREYVNAFQDVLGQDIDIPAPDVYTNPQIMAWMLDEFEKIKGRHEPGFITGKPLEVGGCEIRGDSTSKGGFIIFKELIEKFNLKNAKIAIQGFGNAGGNMAKFLYENNYKVVAVSDSKGGIYNQNGLDIEKIRKIKNEKGSVTEYDAEKISNESLLELNVDVLILAALENQITEKNADKVKAKYIIELANGPISSDADKILHEKGIIVVPDILANSGGVVGSYFEWVQNRTGGIFTVDYIEKQFEKRMKDTFQKVNDRFEQNKRKYSMRQIAYMLAIERIITAEKLRGRIKR